MLVSTAQNLAAPGQRRPSIFPQVVQFENLPECEFERKGQRYSSGRRSCVACNIPCGVENPAECYVLENQRKAAEAKKKRAAEPIVKKRKRKT